MSDITTSNEIISNNRNAKQGSPTMGIPQCFQKILFVAINTDLFQWMQCNQDKHKENNTKHKLILFIKILNINILH